MSALSRQPLPPSLYADTARPPVEAPPLDGDRNVSVAVIGGGFTGLSAALHLAERGADVAVLEAHEPGWGASGRNGGQVNPGLKGDPDEVERLFGPELGRRMARRALELVVQAEASGWWPGYDSAATALELPGYAYQRMQRLAEVEA